VDRNLRPVRAFDVHWRALDGGGVLVRLADQRRFTLDEIGLVLWDRCDGEWSVGDLADELVRLFDVEPDQAAADVETFLIDLEQAELIRLFAVPDAAAAHRTAVDPTSVVL
jgi:hypothetical protein